jgi:hypothetical protein
MTLTKAKLTTSMGYLKFDTRSKAQRIARKLDLSGTHSHEMQGTRIYMPGSDHQKLNRALRREGLPETMMPGQGMTGMGAGDDLDEAMAMDLDPAVEDQLEGGLIDEDVATGVGLGVGDDDDDGEMEIY